jgi:type IV pilus assembly protein PilB
MLPTNHGQSCVMRLLDKDNIKVGVRQLGLSDKDFRQFRNLIRRPNGILLVTGPTGSGKTTTLYAAMNELNRPDRKIITAEDPVEYYLPGVNQVEVRHNIGLDFAKIIRAMLRQAPNVILVGEMRDHETASMGIQASLTGHLVFSTLHTNDAPSTITRMKDMGVPTFLITATVEAILAQRLVRKVCMQCREEYTPPREILEDLELTSEQIRGKRFYRGAGCEVCNNTGYKGRVGLFELMIMNNELRDKIMANAQSDELRAIAQKNGMVSLRVAGIKCCFDGVTTPDEIVRETILEA